ncbi:hypothetical protein [Streptomyces sp. NPDC026659]|uniref:hypothetical protein n=1 Tax=Streptomyces sp. NPDC026659 TaxID=3155123 RepID=UPI0033DCC994
MNRIFGRRAATAAVVLAATAGTLLTVGGVASAAPDSAAGHAATASRGPVAASYGDHRGDGSDHRDGHRDGHRGDGNDHRNGHRGDGIRRDGNGHRWGDRDDRRWDGHRYWVREGRYWYGDDHGRRYRFDNHRFSQWERGMWVVVSGDAHDFDRGVFR